MDKKMTLNALYMLLVVAVIHALSACGGGPSPGAVPSYLPDRVMALRDFPDHAFEVKSYVKGMTEENGLLVWQDPDADLGGYHGVTLAGFSALHLPAQGAFSYEPFIENFEAAVGDILAEKTGGLLRVEGALVECNPGNRALRYFVTAGFGKAAVALVIEVFEPGKVRPSLRIYGRDSASFGTENYGGDSVSMMIHIIDVLAVRMTSVIVGRIDRR